MKKNETAMTVLISGGSVLQHLPGGKVNVLENHDVLIQGSRIAAVEPAGTTNRTLAKKIIDARGRLVMPGLINCHSHVPMVIFRGLAEDVSLDKWFNEYMWPLESNLQEEDVYWGMLLGLAEMIEAGVTTVADHYFFMDHAAEAVKSAGTRAALGWAMFGSQGPAIIDRTSEFITKWNGAAEGRITAWMAPHAPYTCDDVFLRAAAARAKELKVGIHIHAAETKGQTEACVKARGITPIRVLEEAGILDSRALIAHAVGATEQDIEIFRMHSAAVAHCPKTYLKLAMGTAPVVDFLKADVTVGLGTDGAVSNNTLDVWESMRLTAMTQKQAHEPEAMPMDQVLLVAGPGSAEAVGLKNRIGRIEPGMLADLIIVDLDGTHLQPMHSVKASLIYSVRASDVRTVLVNGEILMEDRRLLTIDKQEVVKQVRQSMKRLSQRVPASRIQVYKP